MCEFRVLFVSCFGGWGLGLLGFFGLGGLFLEVLCKLVIVVVCYFVY